jgi:hypothetical protein
LHITLSIKLLLPRTINLIILDKFFRNQLPKENALRKKSDRARKVYDLFFRISDDKIQWMTLIQRIKTFSATSISNLSDDNIKYVATQVRKNIGQN